MRPAALLWLLALCAPASGQDAPSDWVWWEAEDPAATSFPSHTWLSADTFQATRDEILSAGDWLTHDGEREGEEGFARYRVEVPVQGSYSLWARKFWKHGPFRWRFDDGDWRVCGPDVALADSVEIREHVCVNWVALGRVELGAGLHAFELRLLAQEGEGQTSAFDCFLLTRGPFLPRGRLKPGEPSGRSEPGWWAFEPGPDPFGESPIDLRSLNEDVAGQSGYVTRSPGEPAGFRLGDGRPVRFWGVNCGPDVVRLEPELVDRLAQRLARLGVNLVRIHGAVRDARASDPATIDEAYLDRLHYLVAALKRNGIYSELSIYFPLWFQIGPGWEMPGFEALDNKHPFGLIFHDARLQELYFAWIEGLLTTPNPYTGAPLAAEPAVALVELVNEDSDFFWTFDPGRTIPLERIEPLERELATWLAARHGSLEETFEAWDGVRRERDDPENGRVELLGAWFMTAAGCGEGGFRRRVSDQVRFLTERMRRFDERAIERLRALGCRSLIVCGNWKTADPRVLGPLERYTYSAGDVIDQHGYFGGVHEGEGAAWSVRAGHTFADRSGLLEPEAVPLAVQQVAGLPQIVSEIGWPSPNRFQAEFPFLTAAYGALQGLDGVALFAMSGPGWSASVEKFPVSVPSVMGQFPACALLYRRGDVAEAAPSVVEALDLEDLYELRGAALVEPQALDALRAADVPEGALRRGVRPDRVDPLAFLVGPVRQAFDADPGDALMRGLGPWVRREDQVVESPDGVLRWDWGAGVVVLDSPRAQGACGFLGASDAVETADLRIDCASEYASILVVSLDGEPLASSRRVLVQVATEDRPYGWRVEDRRIAALGGHPRMVRELDARLTWKDAGPLREARALDANGYERGPVALQERDGALVLELPRDTLYVLLREAR